MEKATNLGEMIVLFDPRQALSGDWLKFYINRPGNPLRQMEEYLRSVVNAGLPVKVLFTGHVGSGKSTELNKLAESFAADFFIVKLDVQKSLNLTDLEAIDIPLGLLSALAGRATESNLLRRVPGQVAADVWEDLRLFFSRKVLGVDTQAQLKPRADVTVELNALAAKFTARFSQEPSTRAAIRERLQGREEELQEKLNFVARQVRDKYKHPLLFMVEGTDKPSLERARDFFLNHTSTLTRFEVATIYTFPIALRYSGDFTAVKDAFNQHYILPNIKVRTRAGQRDDGLVYLKNAILSRASEDLFAPPVLEQIAEASGGLMRTLVRMVQSAAVHALSYGHSQITSEDAQRAINEEKADYIAALRSDEYPVLAARMADKKLSSDKAVQELLHSRALLEYANGEPWCDVHPVIRELVQRRTAEE